MAATLPCNDGAVSTATFAMKVGGAQHDAQCSGAAVDRA
jgi:hypothetical protein